MPVLKQGSLGPDVTNFSRVKDLGFDPNGVDENFWDGDQSDINCVSASKGQLMSCLAA